METQRGCRAAPGILCAIADGHALLRLARLFQAVALSAAALLFALLALRNEMHLLAVGLGDPLCHYAFVEAAQQLLDSLSIASFDFHLLA